MKFGVKWKGGGLLEEVGFIRIYNPQFIRSSLRRYRSSGTELVIFVETRNMTQIFLQIYISLYDDVNKK
jgi:hypothetical protein